MKSASAVVALSVAVALVLITVVAADLRREYAHEIQSGNEKTATLARILEEQTRQSLQRVEASLRAVNQAVLKGQQEPRGQQRLRQSMQALLALDSRIGSISIIEADGLVTSTVGDNQATESRELVQQDYFVAHQADARAGIFVGASTRSEATGQRVIPVSMRLGLPGQAFQGVIVAELLPGFFQHVFDAVDTGTNGFVTLFTREGWIGARSPLIEKLFLQNWGASPMFKEHLPTDAVKTVRQVVAADGIERIYSYRALSDYPLVISVGVSLTDALVPWRHRLWYEGVALLVVLAALGAATLVVVRQLKLNHRIEAELDLTALSVAKSSLACFWISSDARIVRVNQAACDLHGYTQAQLLGMAITDLDPDFPAERWDLHWAELRDKKRMFFETSQRNSLGALTPVEVDLNFVEFEGREYNFAYVRDISTRKRTQAQLLDAVASAQVASVSKSQFLANMSHEIRTPMNAILGMLTLLRNTELTPRQTDYAVKSEGATRALLGLLNEILDFSKIEAGKMSLDPHPFHVDQLLRDLSFLLSTNIDKKPVEVLFDIDPQLPPQLMGDAMRLQQVLLNLGSNAIKFTTQGEVVLSIQVLHRTADTVTLQFSIRDTGIGIAPENQARIFRGFTQAESSTTRRFGGTGLGVGISQRFVSMMGGELELQSELGKGSRFYFTVCLPIAAQSAEQESQRMQELAECAAWRLLVVDDNPTAREVLEHMVQSLGWQVDLAESGEKALQLLRLAESRNICYQAILVDWNMPGMDGWQTCQHIRLLQDESPPTGDSRKALVMALLTAQGRETLSRRSPAEQSLLDGILVKPVTASMLFEAVLEARSGHASRRAPQLALQAALLRLDGMRLLLVDDNPINQQVARELLEAVGALVQIANHGQEAVDAIAAPDAVFDVVLMDLQMPVMDGFAATTVIRQQLGLAKLPIVAMTANAMASDREACLAVGMNDHVGKPFDLNGLVRVLRRQAQWPDAAPVPVAAGQALSQAVAQAATAAVVDLGAALQRMGGNQDVYRRMLQTFVKDLQAMPAQLQGSLPDEGKRLLHTLKGLAATIGAAWLSAEASASEKVIAANPTSTQATAATQRVCHAIDIALPGLQALLQALQQDHAAANAARAGQAAPNLDRAALVAALQTMEHLLREQDMDAMTAMARLQQQHGEVLGEDAAALELAMADLEFDLALPLCQALVAKYAG